MSAAQGRKRARIACKTCRELKRRCDGQQPCGICHRFEYECVYRESPRGGRRIAGENPRQHDMSPSTQPGVTPPRSDTQVQAPPLHNETQSLEANSGATFLRRLALRLDPKSAPRLHTFAWNAFLGSRKAGCVPVSLPITSILPLATMRELVLVYFQKVDPTYGFLDRQDIEARVERRWAGSSAEPMQDAILCGIAALGSLYSRVQPMKAELDLVESARLILEYAISDVPTTTSITAWVLRVTYLRVADTYHTAWMASCILMHMIEAAGLHREPVGDSILPSSQDVDRELRRRLTAVSQHLNIWMSFDMGRSRVALCNANFAMPSRRPGDHTIELMELLPYSAELDPQKSPTVPELEAALLAVIDREHSIPPSVLAQCNLALCLSRRLQSMGASFTGVVLDQVLALCGRGFQAAQTILDDCAPWHHVANVPFQIVCLLLAIDNPACTPYLRDAMLCLRNVAQVYNTSAIQEALKTASSLIALHIRWKEKYTSSLRDILSTLPDPQVEASEAGPITDPLDTTQWLTSLGGDLSYFNIDEFMTPSFLRDEHSSSF